MEMVVSQASGFHYKKKIVPASLSSMTVEIKLPIEENLQFTQH